MNLIKRIKNLWQLSNFEITEFDNKLVISKKEDKLVVAFEDKPKMAQIVRMKTSVEQFLEDNPQVNE